MTMHLSTIATGNPSIDSILKQLKGHIFSFTGNFPMEILDSAFISKGHEDHQMPGKATLNGITQPTRVHFNLIKNNNPENHFKKISFELELSPQDFNLGKADKKLVNAFLINLDEGFLN